MLKLVIVVVVVEPFSELELIRSEEVLGNDDNGVTDVGTEVVENTGTVDLGNETTERVVKRTRVVMGATVDDGRFLPRISRRFLHPTILVLK